MTASSITFDLADPEYRVNPFPLYEMLRNEAPVHRVVAGAHDGSDLYLVSRFDDVSMALRDKDRFSSHIERDNDMDFPLMVNRDAPEHTRLKRIASKSLNARLVLRLETWVQAHIDELLAEILAQDRVDWTDAYAQTLPVRIIAEMLGVPIDQEGDLRRWTQAVMDGFAVASGLDPDLVPGFYEELMDFRNYLDDLSMARGEGSGRGDIMDEMIKMRGAGDMTQHEVSTTALSFVAGGNETTLNLLGGGVLKLVQDRALAERLRDNPELTPRFVEEFLRHATPIQFLIRRTAVDVELHGVTIPAGELVHLLAGSANRDPFAFPDPDVFDIDRENIHHLGFGAGPHFCPGAALSRLVGELTFKSLYPHLHKFSVDPDNPPQLRTRQGSYGYVSIPLLVSR
jgi:cytochrome P450